MKIICTYLPNYWWHKILMNFKNLCQFVKYYSVFFCLKFRMWHCKPVKLVLTDITNFNNQSTLTFSIMNEFTYPSKNKVVQSCDKVVYNLPCCTRSWQNHLQCTSLYKVVIRLPCNKGVTNHVNWKIDNGLHKLYIYIAMCSRCS